MNQRLGWILAAILAGWLLLPNLKVSWREPVGEAQTGTGLGLKLGRPQPLAPEEIYARAAQAAYKAVVNIDTTQRVRVRDFFDDEFFGFGPRYQESRSQGSGVIVTSDGYILTNEHVVGPAHEAGKTIQVTLTDGRKFPGRVVGADHTTDVALVKVDATGLPAARLGTVQGLVPGQLVVAIGNPFGLMFTVTHGVVSALGRPIQVDDRIYSNLIQHDALINPGNSGGALVNLEGQVIGINTLIDPRAQGIGFAIPIDTALKVADELKRYGKIKRPWLGLIVDTNSAYYVTRYGVADVQGAIVRGVVRGGPAAASGILPGDVILRINGERITSEDAFKAAEEKLRIGQRVSIEVARQDERAQGTITVGEMP